jgi:hypothetical protein
MCILLVPLLSAATPAGGVTAKPPAACGAIPDGEPLIGGLQSGQVIEADGTTTLRFADRAYGCNEWPNSVGCETMWTFRVTLPLTGLGPGSFDLAELGADFGYLTSDASLESGAGCSSEQNCKGSVYGVGTEPVGEGGLLEIYSVAEGCVTGKLSGLTSEHSPNVDGAFFALPCPN